ncbi:unnamed protein product [Schistosoma curassoni]|uniref:Transmembrane protein n=1 Tax=Schistosoma curassoni TaxID=6186 RepID=A0A183KE74_9TREM|nr:unnamed protein product [Schistosoma curassoni]
MWAFISVSSGFALYYLSGLTSQIYDENNHLVDDTEIGLPVSEDRGRKSLGFHFNSSILVVWMFQLIFTTPTNQFVFDICSSSVDHLDIYGKSRAFKSEMAINEIQDEHFILLGTRQLDEPLLE